MAQNPSSDEPAQATVHQLRTLSFRMREIQRLLAMRVDQENRRLEAEGLEQVSEPAFHHQSEQE
jgi:hypothetical protein